MSLSRQRSVRRMLVDLTPLIDIIMILLFGVMINSSEMYRADTSTLVLENDQLRALTEELRQREDVSIAKKAYDSLMQEKLKIEDRLDSVETMLKEAQNNLAAAVGELERRKSDFSQAMSKVLAMSDEQSKNFREALEKMSPTDAMMLDRAIARIRTWQTPADVYKGIRRIEEMQKFFDFIDVHLDEQEQMHLIVNGRSYLPPQPVYRNKARIVELLRQVVEDNPTRESLLVLSSNDIATDDLTTVYRDEALREVETYFETRPRGPNLQVVPIGSLPEPPERVQGALEGTNPPPNNP